MRTIKSKSILENRKTTIVQYSQHAFEKSRAVMALFLVIESKDDRGLYKSSRLKILNKISPKSSVVLIRRQ